MRILSAFAGGPGHAEPLVPVATAAAAAGHDVLFAGRPSALESLAARGFSVHAGRGAREKAPTLVELFASWRPDVVVCEESDFGSMTATPADVREAVEDVLSAPRFRASAESLRDDFAALPGPDQAVARIKALPRSS